MNTINSQLRHNQTIKAGFPCCSKSDLNAVVTYLASDELKEEGITECAWVEYQDTLVEAFYFENEGGWCLDDIGLGETLVKDTPNGYPGSENLKATSWELVPTFSEYAQDYFWHPVRKSTI